MGGGLLEKPGDRKKLVKQLLKIKDPWILVHGGGRMASDLARQLGQEPVMIEGRRVTDKATIKLVTMVYAGYVNKNLVADLQSSGMRAIGLCGADGGLMISSQRPSKPIDFGLVGDITPEGINEKMIEQLLQSGLHPVIAPITMGEHGVLLNTNADTIASVIAQKLAGKYEVSLLLCFEKNGVLRKPTDPSSRIPVIDRKEYQSLRKAGIVSGGMIPKLDLALEAVDHGVRQVWVGPGDHLAEVQSNPEKAGTWIQKS